MPERQLTFSVDIDLSQKRVRSLCDQITTGGLTDTQKIAGLAESALQDLADGGELIPGHVMQQIHNSVGDIDDYQELVRYVETGVGMQNGSPSARWTPDPTYQPVIQEAANSQGITLQQHIQQLMDYVAGQGWLFDLRPDTVAIYFTKKDFKNLCEMLDTEHVTGQEIIGLIQESENLPEEEEKVEVQS